MSRLTDKVIPCWMKLVWQDNPPTIGILVHQSIVHELYKIPAVAPIIPIYLHSLPKGTTFSAASEGGWGFNASLKQAQVTPDGFVPFVFEIPLVKKTTENDCTFCNGTGHDDERDDKCPHCTNGKCYYYDRATIWPLSASIALLCMALGRFPPENDTPSQAPQLLSFDVCASSGRYGLSGEFSFLLVDWFRRLGVQNLETPTSAMTAVWTQMHGQKEKGYHRFDAQIAYASGWVNIHCPGDACSLNPDSGHVPETGGYSFSDHNIDGPFQLLTLLAALAAIETEARQALGY